MCDLGLTLSNAEVTTILPTAMWSTIQLVTISLVVAIILGIIVGIATALRQYSGFDFSMTFVSFFLYSLPSFLVAVLLKEFIAIDFNDFLQRDPTLSVIAIALIAIVLGLIWQVFIGGDLRRRAIVFAVSAVATAALLAYMSLTNWFINPGFGPVGLLLLIAAVAVGTTATIAGLSHRRTMIVAGVNGLIAYVSYFALQGLFDVSTIGTILILGVVTLIVSLAIGYFAGGNDRSQVIKVSAITGVLSAALVVVDRFMQAWPVYMSNPRINNRPIATVGSQTPGFSGDFWVSGLDSFTHLLLPTISLLLISFAGYTRYARSGLLEVMNQDYIRTARAKGLPERTVIVRHAFRNMLIPIATLIAVDVGNLLGGAVITEFVFSIPGMGQLFNTSLQRVDLNPVMGYFLVIAIVAIAFNFIADLMYAALDPRVRVH